MRVAVALLLVSACTGLSPLRGRAVVGRDGYAIFVADGPEGETDLFGVRTDGGPVFQITYTNVLEAAPALSPDGGAVGFLRGASARDSLPATVWVLNLLTGAERELPLPVGAPVSVRTQTAAPHWTARPNGGSPRRTQRLESAAARPGPVSTRAAAAAGGACSTYRSLPART